MTRLAAGDVAGWVLTSAEPPEAMSPGWPAGTARTLDRCLRPSYRLGLMRPGAACLLWVSARDRPGVHAVGLLADVPHVGPARPEVPVRFVRLARHVPREEFVAAPDFAGAEVVRLPAGSNPSWLSVAQFATVLARLEGVAAEGRPPAPGSMEAWVATGSGGERSAGS